MPYKLLYKLHKSTYTFSNSPVIYACYDAIILSGNWNEDIISCYYHHHFKIFHISDAIYIVAPCTFDVPHLKQMGLDKSRSPVINMDNLPEDCLAEILSYTGPVQSCKLATVSPSFSSASQSSAVWDKFLPPDCCRILSGISSDNVRDSLLQGPKKQLYLTLCQTPVLIDDGRKSFSLDKLTGKKCFMISARELRIVWGDTPFYWRWASDPNSSRFCEVAELVNVCWFEIGAKIQTHILSPSTHYAAYLVFKYSQPERGIGREEVKGSEELPEKRNDGWVEVELGEFFVGEGGERKEVEIELKEIAAGPKSGMVVLGMEIRPKHFYNSFA
ncbi:F-box protein At2g02240 [Linum perenne]